MTPPQRVMLIADLSSGCGKTLPFDEFQLPSADLTVNLHRSAQGEWIGMDSIMRASDVGIVTADGQLFDETGAIGCVTQTCMVSRR